MVWACFEVRLTIHAPTPRLAAAHLSYSELVELVRFHAALEALADPDQKLIDIASQLGYYDQATFTRAFRRWTGVAPGAFRRQYGAPAESGVSS